jgi:hypothetical protein
LLVVFNAEEGIMSISFLDFDEISAPRTKPGTERESDEQKSDKEKADEAVEEAEEESFPASDAPAYPDFR